MISIQSVSVILKVHRIGVIIFDMKEFVFLASWMVVFVNVYGMPRFSMNLSADGKSLRKMRGQQNLKACQQITLRKPINNLSEKLYECIWNYMDLNSFLDQYTQ